MTHSLIAQPLSNAAFAPFGEVIETAAAEPLAINDGSSDRYHDLATLDLGDLQGRPCLSIFCAQPHSLPMAIRLLERHPLSTQTFIPLEPARFLIVVSAPGHMPTDSSISAFVSNGHQGVNYHRGCWHHPLIALESVTEFLVLDREGPEENCDEWFPGNPLTVETLE